ncbi:MAG: Stk1 family PASTA domain-containing Ser/Thr kinase, partial [Nocardioidaceae bacterium]
MSTTSNESLVGRLLDDRYRIGDRIARGGMASVYFATDVRLDRTVAVKVMHTGLGDDDDFTARFEREARSAARLNHPNVVAVFDQGEDQGLVYLVMEYVPGRTLRDVIRAEAPMPPSRALALLDPLLVALSAAHEARIIHRDVKPENVLITPDGRVKVADFGLARAVSSATTSTATTGVLIGTISYLAPELVVNHGADTRSDVYAVGAMLYEMLTGSKPHTGESPIQIAYKHVHEDVPPPSASTPGIPPYLDALVARTTSRDRDQRSADANVALRQVRRARVALDQGLHDDLELTQDLRPHRAVGPDPFAGEDSTMLVPSAAPPVATEDTYQQEHWDRTAPFGPGTADTAAVQAPVRLPVRRAPDEYPGAGAGGPAPRTRTKRRRGPILLIVVLVLALLAGFGGWYYGVGRFDDTPNLEGLAVKRAEHKAQSAGFTLEVADQSFDETVPKGTIISTDPGPGERILPDGTIDATVSKGKERYAVPSLAGRTEDEASAALADLHLRLGDVKRKYSEKVDEDKIIKTVLDTDTLVRRGTRIDVVVSKGRRPIEVKDFTGDPAKKATGALQKAGLDPRTEHAYDDEVEKGRVISQSPHDGTLYKGDDVELVVSDGPEPVEVPSVVGKGKDEATRILRDAGFEVKVEKEQIYVGGGLVLR